MTDPKSESTPVEGLSYEEALNELQEIVSNLESGERSLEETLALYQRGQVLARYCAGLLDQAELKLQQISGESVVDIQAG